MVYTTTNVLQTHNIAQKLAEQFKNGAIILLSGELGSGKTTITQGFAKALGITDRILSPTFTIMRVHDIPGNNQGKFYHIDLYRLEKASVSELGIDEIIKNPHNIVIIEWPEHLSSQIFQKPISIRLKIIKQNTREIEVY